MLSLDNLVSTFVFKLKVKNIYTLDRNKKLFNNYLGFESICNLY